jgi:predicted ABC-type transport system involved in lysophospholipase L1 biosynthesis ATPase subunit
MSAVPAATPHAAAQMALRYSRHGEKREIALAVPVGSVRRVELPDAESKSAFVTAVLKARCEADEELELFGQPVRNLSGGARQRLRARVGALSPIIGLINNLNAWENISLPAAYHGKPSLAEVATITQGVLDVFGIEPRDFLVRVPDELGKLERKIAAFARLMIASPELAIVESLNDGLSRAECARVAGFEQEYRRRHPAGTLLFVDIREE